MEQGAWSKEHGAWSMEHGRTERKENALGAFLERGQTVWRERGAWSRVTPKE